ncbi:unnamed protein product [Adineta steineri]|uniref:LIM interaction domain-containing protein n=1 Tax=Adineta steineri TaxID=433720 RepID=A0A819A0E7_9BILA|nr:unnamed protein product [Adineta steineri]CAF3774978.1 unnamed protein product [Adineta steineri]
MSKSKVDPTGFQSGVIDSPNPVGIWQGPPHPSSLPPLPPHHHHQHPGRFPIMPPRELHFPPQHMRQFRPSLPPPSSPEYRIYDLNKRLLMRTEESDNHWWDSFVNEFFEEDATITISICLEDGPKRFHVGRGLIPRFFRMLFDGGVSEVYFLLKQTKEIFHNTTLSIDCEQGSLITCFGKPSHIKVCTEGHFNIEFTFDDLMRIKSWHFSIKQHRELIPRSVVAIPNDSPAYLDQLSKNFTRHGLTLSMLNFLRLCEILEPMQEIMSRHKTTSFSPRDCLKTILHQRWSKTCSDTRPPAKTRRKRKNTVGNNNNLPPTKDTPMTNCTTPTKKRSPANNIYSQPSTQGMNNMPGDVMIVGEPSLMGGEMDDEDERYITRLENTQYDPNSISTQYHSPNHQMTQGYQQNPNLQSLLHPKQQFLPNSNQILNPNQIKREQISFPGSPQQQQQQLPSMFSNNPPTPNGINTSLNGELSTVGKRISTTNINSSSSPQTPSANNYNQNSVTPSTMNIPNPSLNTSWNNSSSSTINPGIAEKKQEPHTPPVTPQHTIATAS